jgi:hypothetical protein
MGLPRERALIAAALLVLPVLIMRAIREQLDRLEGAMLRGLR